FVALIVGDVGSGDLGGLAGNHVLSQKDDMVPATGEPPPVALPVPPPIAAGALPSDSDRLRGAPPSLAAPEPTGLRLSADEITVLVARVDSFLTAGDIASARLFFERAADAGDGRAALRMALTFDAAFLVGAGVHGA